jgi:hypothetical protein
VEKVDGVGDKVDDVKEKMDELGELVRQSFRYLYHDLQQKEETHCPNLFVIWKAAKGKPFHVPMRLALCCQHPGHEHIACRPDKKGEPYEIDALQDHLRKAAPLLKGVRKVLKYAKLTGLSAVKEWDKALGDFLGESQETMDALLEDFGSISEKGEAPDLLLEDIDHGDRQLKEKRVAGAALREFRALLDKVDPDKTWHGLVKKRSNLSGEYLWVCEKHAEDKSYLR